MYFARGFPYRSCRSNPILLHRAARSAYTMINISATAHKQNIYSQKHVTERVAMKASAPQTAPPPSTQLRTLVSRGSCVVTQLFASLVVGLSAAIVFWDNASLSQEPTLVSASIVATSEVPSYEIKQLVNGLEYPDEVARDFVRAVSRWKDAQGRAVSLFGNNSSTRQNKMLNKARHPKINLLT